MKKERPWWLPGKWVLIGMSANIVGCAASFYQMRVFGIHFLEIPYGMYLQGAGIVVTYAALLNGK